MQAITVIDHAAGVGGLSLTDVPYPTPPKTMSSCGSMPRDSPPAS
jgi:hypothetical protein